MFKKGDRVKYIGRDFRFHNQIGTVIGFLGSTTEIAFVHFPNNNVYMTIKSLKIVDFTTLNTE